MKKISLALLGRNIAHSKSQKMYEDIFNQSIEYRHFDCSNENEIPSLNEIFENILGLSITAPYKKHFLDQVEMSDEIKELNAINCIRKTANSYHATNTDFEAIIKIMDKYQYYDREIIILGSGSMSHVTQSLLKQRNKSFKAINRKDNGPLEEFDLVSFCETSNPLIINTCSRAFHYIGNIPKDSVFWDYNYSHEANKGSIGPKCDYMDGLEMLKLQAESAVDFWGLRKI